MSYREQSTVFVWLDCDPGCEGSRAPVETCRCRCRGINHGRAWTGETRRPVGFPAGETGYSESPYGRTIDMPTLSLPHIQPALPEKRPAGFSSTVSFFRKPSVKRRLARGIGRAIGYESATSKNERIITGLKAQFHGEKVDAILEAAFTAYFLRVGPEANRPELYELFENGDIDAGLEQFRARWVIGRPKFKTAV